MTSSFDAFLWVTRHFLRTLCCAADLHVTVWFYFQAAPWCLVSVSRCSSFRTFTLTSRLCLVTRILHKTVTIYAKSQRLEYIYASRNTRRCSGGPQKVRIHGSVLTLTYFHHHEMLAGCLATEPSSTFNLFGPPPPPPRTQSSRCGHVLSSL
jgi:hypothetical protein